MAMAAGMSAQAIARHARLPGIVLLLGVGVLLGPDVANIVRPATMSIGLGELVGFAVAIILFEGGLNLRIQHLRHQAKPIQRLITIGAFITAAGAALVCKLVMGWEWRIALLFGTLVIVTGPTVITPLLRRIRVRHSVSTILEAEGIFIDAVGATIAVVALEVALYPSLSSLAIAIPDIALRIGGGALIGAAGGGLLILLLHRRHIIPRGMENILSLAFAVAIFQVSNALLHESGITAAIVAGFVVGNRESHALDDLVEFKEQLTVLLIATLFVLLAADVRVDDVLALGWPGLITVILLMILVRPLTVIASTYRTDVTRREKVFLSWLAPRGIIAAAVASLFAIDLAAADIPGGVEMRALVFLVIAMTVTLQGLTGGLLARALGLKRASNDGVLFLGANELALLMGEQYLASGEKVAYIDANPEACRLAESRGFKAYVGNGLDEHILRKARVDSRLAVIGITGNESINLLFCREVNEHFYGPKAYVALESTDEGVTTEMLDVHETRLLFGAEARLGWWTTALAHDRATTENWTMGSIPDDDTVEHTFEGLPSSALLPLIVWRGKSPLIPDSGIRLRQGDEVRVAVAEGQEGRAYEWMRLRHFIPKDLPSTERNGSEPAPAPEPEPEPEPEPPEEDV